MDETHGGPELPARPYIDGGLDVAGDFTPDQLVALGERRLELTLGRIRPRVYEGSGTGGPGGPGWVAVSLAQAEGEERHRPEPLTHVHVHAAPGGVSWGYAGSGPADLALSILVDALEAAGHDHGADTDALAWRYHQRFKTDHVATWPAGGPWVLTETQVMDWLLEAVEARAERTSGA